MAEKYRRKRKSGKSILEAKFEAQKLAFAPLSFQATKALRDLGILQELNKSAEKGLSISEIVKILNLSEYTVGTLLEVGSGLDLVSLNDNKKYVLTKTGFFILTDEMTRVNMDFVNDVCYQGAFFLQESLQESKPKGLKVFGDWATIYQGLAHLPKNVQTSWFAFDHYYSDAAFLQCLGIIFDKKNSVKNLCDIGGNTGKWALQCLKHNSEVTVTIVDLKGQLEKAKQNIEENNFSNRVKFHEANILDSAAVLPKNADVVWMSQFLDCFSKEQIIDILKKVAKAIDEKAAVYILEPFWDQQKYQAAAFSLNHTSLYFTAMANGNSKMYSCEEMLDCINQAGLKPDQIFNEIGANDYTLLKCSKK